MITLADTTAWSWSRRRAYPELRASFDAALIEGEVAKHWDRALRVYEQLSARGGALQRSVKHPDLLIAAAAELADGPLLHYDDDYAQIAEITGQATRWLAPKGSLR